MEFAVIFTEMSWIAGLLLILGLAFTIVEIFVPGFGVFGVLGIGSTIAGVVVRICDGLNLTQSLTLIMIVVGAFALLVMFMVFSAQHGALGRSGLFERKSSLDKNYNEVSKEYRKLKGKSGKAITSLNLAGKAKIKGKVYDVVSLNSFIEKGSHVKVIEIRDNSIVVRKWFE